MHNTTEFTQFYLINNSQFKIAEYTQKNPITIVLILVRSSGRHAYIISMYLIDVSHNLISMTSSDEYINLQ